MPAQDASARLSLSYLRKYPTGGPEGVKPSGMQQSHAGGLSARPPPAIRAHDPKPRPPAD